jgi:hypothetical protein
VSWQLPPARRELECAVGPDGRLLVVEWGAPVAGPEIDSGSPAPPPGSARAELLAELERLGVVAEVQFDSRCG